MKMPSISLRGVLITELTAVLSFISLTLIQMNGFAGDPGVGWHLESGDYILNNHHVPKIDPFLAAHAPLRWVSDQWGGDLIFALLFRAAGYPLIYAVLTAVFLITFFWFALRPQVKLTGSAISSVLAALCAFKIAQIHFILRPVVFGFLFFAVLGSVIIPADFKRSDFQKSWWFLPLLFIFWANIHPTFVLGLVLLALFCLCRGIKEIRYLMLFLTCAAATLINPYGVELHKSILALGHSTYFMNLHMEWQSPNFKDIESKIFEIIIAVLFIVQAIVRNRRFPLSLFAATGLLTFAHFGLEAVRMLPFFGIFAAPYFAAALVDGGIALQEDALWIGQRIGNLFVPDDDPSYAGSKLAWLFSFVTILSSLLYGSIPLFHGEFGPQREKFPYAATQFLLDKIPSGSSAAIVSSPDWGGFLIRYGENRLKPVIDDRNTLLGEEAYKSFYQDLRINGDYKGYIKSFNARYLLLPAHSELAYGLKKDPEMQLLFEDSVSALFFL
jgi:hypothetical protein